MTNLVDYKIVARVGEEEHIPKYGIDYDARFFDLDSLIRMYGEEEVERYIRKVRREGGGK